MARPHAMTPARRAALKKAQLASARKRRGKGKGKLAAANRQLSAKKGSSTGKKILQGAVVAAGLAHVGYQMHSWHRSSQASKARFNQQTAQIHGQINRDIAHIHRQAQHARHQLRLSGHMKYGPPKSTSVRGRSARLIPKKSQKHINKNKKFSNYGGAPFKRHN